MSDRVKEIAAAMNGRTAAQVNDNSLRDSVRDKVVGLAQASGRPLGFSAVSAIVAAVLRAAAQTLIYEGEVVIALEMGAAGELEHEGLAVNQINCSKWILAYAVSGVRSAAKQSLSLGASRDRARADAAVAQERNEEFKKNGVLRAWQTFVERGSWDFFPGYAAVLYDMIGRDAITQLLTPEQLEKARVAAISVCRHDYPQKYRTAKEEEIVQTDVFKLHAKAQLCRTYFETLREKSLDINLQPIE